MSGLWGAVATSGRLVACPVAMTGTGNKNPSGRRKSEFSLLIPCNSLIWPVNFVTNQALRSTFEAG